MLDEMTPEERRRRTFAFTLIAVLFVVHSILFPPQPVESSPQATLDESTAASTEQPPGTPAAVLPGAGIETVEAPDTAAPAPVIPAPKAVALRTDSFQAKGVGLTFSNRGATLVEARVESPDQYVSAGDILTAHPEAGPYPFLFSFEQGDSLWLPTDAIFEVVEDESRKNESGAYERLTYRYTDPQGRFVASRTYEAKPEQNYGLTLSTEIVNRTAKIIKGTPTLELTLVKTGGEESRSAFFGPSFTDIESICRQADDIERGELVTLGDPEAFLGTTTWAAVNTRMFLFAAVFAEQTERCDYERLHITESGVSDNLHQVEDGPEANALRTRVRLRTIQLEPSAVHRSAMDLYIGPKEMESLEEAGHRLSDAVDYGVLTFLCSPLRWLLKQFYELLGNWGFAIILMTFLLRTLIYPLNHKMYANMEKMKVLQPELEKVRNKYKDDQQRVAEETMKLFKEHGTTPLSGCLPMLIQMPIFFALYYMILNSVELYQAPFILWYDDLSAPDPYYALPIAMGIVMFLQHSMMSVETPNPQMKVMMKFMPIMFAGFMLFLPAGLNLYYFFNTVLAVAQQWWIKRQFADKPAPTAT